MLILILKCMIFYKTTENVNYFSGSKTFCWFNIDTASMSNAITVTIVTQVSLKGKGFFCKVRMQKVISNSKIILIGCFDEN